VTVLSHLNVRFHVLLGSQTHFEQEQFGGRTISIMIDLIITLSIDYIQHTKHNDIQNKDTKHNVIQNMNTKHNDIQNMSTQHNVSIVLCCKL
jgi:hypothetical protein